YKLAQRLLDARSFLHQEQHRSPRDPIDRALLVQEELSIFASAKISAETVTPLVGDTFSATRSRQEAPLPAWSPSAFPPGMSQQEMENSPKLPRIVREIPQFQMGNVRWWTKIVQRGPPFAQDTPENALNEIVVNDLEAKRRVDPRASKTAF